MEELTINLPEHVYKYVASVAALANVSAECVINVLLSMHMISEEKK